MKLRLLISLILVQSFAGTAFAQLEAKKMSAKPFIEATGKLMLSKVKSGIHYSKCEDKDTGLISWLYQDKDGKILFQNNKTYGYLTTEGTMEYSYQGFRHYVSVVFKCQQRYKLTANYPHVVSDIDTSCYDSKGEYSILPRHETIVQKCSEWLDLSDYNEEILTPLLDQKLILDPDQQGNIHIATLKSFNLIKRTVGATLSNGKVKTLPFSALKKFGVI